MCPQLFSVQVVLPTVDGGIHCWIVVPPIDEWISPIGTAGSPSSASSAILSAKFFPKYQHMALNRCREQVGPAPGRWSPHPRGTCQVCCG